MSTVIGCGSPDYASLSEQAEKKVAEAVTLAGSGDNQGAVDLITEAMRSGGIHRGNMGEACKWRAVCYARLGDYDKAKIDVQTLMEVSPTAGEAEVVLSYVYEKQGLKREAVEAFRRARRSDPKIERITD